MQKLNWRVLLVVGLTAGVIQSVAGIVMYVAGVYFLPWSMLVSGLVLILCIVLGIRWYRNNTLGGTISYLQALVVGIVISASTGLVYALYNFISVSFFYPNFMDEFVRASQAQIQAGGLGPDQTAELMASVKRNASLPLMALSNLVRLTIIGSVLSSIIALFLRRKA